jgi:lipopolysaccharide/colanic/teichoic acid biosynthesis glycosyltransferase
MTTKFKAFLSRPVDPVPSPPAPAPGPAVSRSWPEEMVQVSEGPWGGWYAPCKRAVDVLLALVLLVAAAPVVLLCAVLVRLTSKGPAFYTQLRVGRNGRTFWIYKLRTMAHDCEKQSGAQWSRPGDKRVTRLGRFLRRTHLDELPQLWNVLRGDMSLVGPRPERPEFVPGLAQVVPGYNDRHRVRPGVTGLAQVQLPADTDVDSVRLKTAYDLYYIRHAGLWLDLRLILCAALRMCAVPFHVLGRLFGLPRPRLDGPETGTERSAAETLPELGTVP